MKLGMIFALALTLVTVAGCVVAPYGGPGYYGGGGGYYVDGRGGGDDHDYGRRVGHR